MTWGQLFQNQPPAPSQLAVGRIFLPLLLSTAMYGLDRREPHLSDRAHLWWP